MRHNLHTLDLKPLIKSLYKAKKILNEDRKFIFCINFSCLEIYVLLIFILQILSDILTEQGKNSQFTLHIFPIGFSQQR